MNLRETPLYRLYGGPGEEKTGRRAILADGIVKTIILYLGKGTFFTGFFMLYGVNIVNISILTLVPYLASAAAVFAPLLLERAPRRKPLLLAGRALYYLLYLLVLTLLPMLMGSSPLLIPVCVAVVFVSNVLGNASQSGLDAWFLDFLPENIRARHFSYMVLWPELVSTILALLSSLVVDASAGTAAEGPVLLAVRFIVVALGALDIWICARPAERSRVQGASQVSLREIFTIPMRNAAFMGITLLITAYTFTNSLYLSTQIYYLLDECGISYTYINFMNMTYPFTLLFLQPFWRRLLQKTSWTWVYAVSILIFAVSNVFYAFVNGANYLVLMTIVRLVQHISGAGSSMTCPNLVYRNTPVKNRTSYISFYNVLINVAAFGGMTAGTAVVDAMGQTRLAVLGSPLGSVQLLMLASGLLSLAVIAVLFANLRRFEPPAGESS